MDARELKAKVAAMSDAEKQAFVDEIYAEAHPSNERLELFYAIMLGRLEESDEPEVPASGAPCPYEIELSEPEIQALDASLTAKIAAMSPAERVQRREEILGARPSFEGDMEFGRLMAYDDNGEPWQDFSAQ